MCYITKHVYTVCAHTAVGELVECREQKSRNEQWREGGWCAGWMLALSRCRPAERVQLKYWFCPDCRNFYRGYDTSTVDAVLNYWAYKNARGYAFSVSPQLVPAPLVFGRPASELGDPKLARGELVALDKALPRRCFETPAEWLFRLEDARARTLALAEEWTRGRALSARRRQARESASGGGGAVRMQPRLSAPMSVYPYEHALSAITEQTEPQSEPQSARETGAAAAAAATADAPPPEAQESRNPTPQVHLETLRKLCGEAEVPLQAGEAEAPSHAGEAEGPSHEMSSPVGHEGAAAQASSPDSEQAVDSQSPDPAQEQQQQEQQPEEQRQQQQGDQNESEQQQQPRSTSTPRTEDLPKPATPPATPEKAEATSEPEGEKDMRTSHDIGPEDAIELANVAYGLQPLAGTA
ncbi:047f4ab7-48e5-4a38-a2bb-8fced771068e [Thermothielavioides terrestris]|uniref:047f4ab7-48e5-4a38-a2bb-8fced771068e n=1 Tax=Thermothielavioides terrestris TaxID=2587410 RepID=A0A3S4AKB2_9PEZI|nr:047f4ab7-48e5-4a38-a2bb-8fced771068e [Thermothielavioides terrestris]